MSDYLKKGFLLGLGAAISGKEKLDQKLKELVDKNELTQEQAKTVMKNFIEKGEMKKMNGILNSLRKRKTWLTNMGLQQKKILTN